MILNHLSPLTDTAKDQSDAMAVDEINNSRKCLLYDKHTAVNFLSTT